MSEQCSLIAEDESFQSFKRQFVADHPEIAKCPRALVAHLHALDSHIDRGMTSAGHVVTDEIAAMCAGFLMISRFLKEEFAHCIVSEL